MTFYEGVKEGSRIMEETELIDTAGSIRSGEELNAARLEEYLKDNIAGLSGELIVK